MSASVERVAIVLGLMLGTSLLPACRASEASRNADAGAAPFADAPPDPLSELQQLEGRMLELGLTPARIETPMEEHQPAPDQGAHTEGVLVEEKAADVGDVGEAGEAGKGEWTEDDRDARQVDGTTAQPPPSEPQVGPVQMTEREDHRGESRCTSVCELSEAICELEVRICTMAKNHGSDPTYVDACERAVDDCELSGDACDTCVE